MDWECSASISSHVLWCSPIAIFAKHEKRCNVMQGYAFCEFQEIGLTDYVIQNLNGKQIGNKFLTVKRALQPGPVAF